LRGYLISARAPTLFTSYLSFGLTFYIVFQAFLNIGVVIGILPVTGIQLPFISYGGTSLIIAMSSTGVILNISKYKRREIYENNNLSRRNRRTSLSSY
jgi:cell division protein FtsW